MSHDVNMKSIPTCRLPRFSIDHPPRGQLRSMTHAATRSMNSQSLSRRKMRYRAWLTLLTGLALLAVQADAAPALAVRIAFIGTAAGDAHAGASQGIREANAQGKFLGLNYELVMPRTSLLPSPHMSRPLSSRARQLNCRRSPPRPWACRC